MEGCGRQPENVELTAASVERLFEAIRFQTSILALNAAVEAAHVRKPEACSPAPAEPARIASRCGARSGREVMSASWLAAPAENGEGLR